MIGVLLVSLTVASGDVQVGLHQRPTDTLRLYAVGDINLGRRLAKERLLEGDTLYPFLALRDSLASADITFGNLESPIAPDSSPAPDSVGVFTAPAAAAAALARAEFDVVSTANNHAWDGGRIRTRHGRAAGDPRAARLAGRVLRAHPGLEPGALHLPYPRRVAVHRLGGHRPDLPGDSRGQGEGPGRPRGGQHARRH
ncbi:MAG: hypothetical protein DMD42_13265 [Gemmatimonadetes bacterium]|nr:MAG: hypothetical protein DMD42_13265 [Gemmatimonadota bacterium]